MSDFLASFFLTFVAAVSTGTAWEGMERVDTWDKASGSSSRSRRSSCGTSCSQTSARTTSACRSRWTAARAPCDERTAAPACCCTFLRGWGEWGMRTRRPSSTTDGTSCGLHFEFGGEKNFATVRLEASRLNDWKLKIFRKLFAFGCLIGNWENFASFFVAKAAMVGGFCSMNWKFRSNLILTTPRTSWKIDFQIEFLQWNK